MRKKKDTEEEQFYSIFQQASDAFVVFDQEGDVIDVNESMCKFSGYTREEHLQMNVADYFDPEKLKTDPLKFHNAKIGEHVIRNRELRIKSGESVEVEINTKKISENRLYAIVRDISRLREAEERVTLSESALHSAFEYSPIGMAMVSLEGKWIKVNRALCKMLGYTEKELLKLTFRDIAYTEDEEKDLSLIQQIEKTKADSYQIEKRCYHKKGTIVWAKLNMSIVRNSEGEPLFYVSQIEDITEKRLIAEHLQEKEQQFRLFIEHSPAALAMLDTNMRYLIVSRRWLADYNLDYADVIGKSHYEVFPNLPQSWKDIHQQCLKGAIEKNDEDHFVREDGTVEWIRWEIHPWHKAGGEVGGIIMFTEVITEKKEAELKFRNLVEQSQVGVYIIQNNMFAYVNPRFAEIFGYRQEELINTIEPEELVSKEFKQAIHSSIKARISGEFEHDHYVAKGMMKDGENIWMEVYGSRTLYNGSPAVIGSLIDITESKNAEQEAAERTVQLSMISNNLPDTMIYQVVRETNGEMNFTYLSNGITRLTGISAEEALKKSDILYNHLNKADLPMVRAAEQVSFQNLSLFNIDVRFTLVSGEERLMNLRSIPHKLADGRVIWDGILSDITERKKTELEMLRLNRLYLFKSKTNELMLKSSNKEEFFSRICEIAVEFGKFQMAWIGFYDAEKQRAIPHVWAGYEDGYLDNIRIPTGNYSTAIKGGPTGRAIRTRLAHCCNDIATDPNVAPWREEALKRNYRSSAALPIIVNNELEAVLSVYMTEPYFFNDAEMSLLQGIIDNVSFGLDKIRIAEQQKKTETDLRENIQINKAMINAFPDKIFRLKEDGTFVYVHAPDSNLYKARENIIGHHITKVLPEKEATLILEAMEKALQTGELVTVEYSLIINNAKQYLEGRLIVVDMADEKQVLMIVRDITEAKKAEIALERSIRQISDYRYAIDQSSLVDISDRKGVITYANDNFCKISKYTREELIGQDHRILNSAFHSKAFFHGLWSTVLRGNVWHHEIREKAKDGSFFWVDTTIVPFLDDDGKPYQYVSIRKDITKRKKTESELMDSEEKFRTVVEQTLLNVFILQNNKLIYVNPRFVQTIGYTQEQLLNEMPFINLIHEDDQEMIKNNIRLRISGEEAKNHYIFKALKSDGSILQIEMIASLIIYNGAPAIIGTAIDITEKMEEEARIARAVSDAQENERLQIGMELHDNVKQLLVACNISISFAQKKLDDRAKAEEHLKHSREIINKAMTDLRYISHQLAPLVETDLPIAESIKLLTESMNISSFLKVTVTCDEAIQIVPKHIHLAFYRILQEQLNNILRYATASNVTIAITTSGHKIRMSIKDDGQGFDTSKKRVGIGFENIKRRIIGLHGQTEIISSPTQGCEVIVSVPV